MNEELVAQCRAHPDDPQSWAVLVDTLIAAEDSLGEYAALAAAGKLAEAEALRPALLGDHDGELAGMIAIVEHRHGFPVELTLVSEAALDRILASRFAAFVEMLALDSVDDLVGTAATIAASLIAPFVTSIEVGGRDETAAPLVLDGLPALRRLSLSGGSDLHTDIEDLPPSIRQLELTDNPDGEHTLRALVDSATLPRLRVLDLSGSVLASGSAGTLVYQAEKFAHLERLVLDNCYFTAEEVAAIAAKLPNASLLEQQRYEPVVTGEEGDDDHGDRYMVTGRWR